MIPRLLKANPVVTSQEKGLPKALVISKHNDPVLFQCELHMLILPTVRVRLERVAGGVEVPPLVGVGLLLEGLPAVVVS